MSDVVTVEVIRYPTDDDWKLCRRAALNTVGREWVEKMPSDQWKRCILRACHSPIRVLNFYIHAENVPTYVATHFARHVHLVPFIQSQRNDRQFKYDRDKAPQDAPVMMDLYLNAEELQTMMRKRLCMKADPKTTAVAEAIRDAVLVTNPEFEGLLCPQCERYGRCDEMHPCARIQNILR